VTIKIVCDGCSYSEEMGDYDQTGYEAIEESKLKMLDGELWCPACQEKYLADLEEENDPS
jgi:hypothetical protein